MSIIGRYLAIRIMEDIGLCDGRNVNSYHGWINAWMYCNCCWSGYVQTQKL